jgi:uncharacterized repeat protein (TIGR03803 family)
MCFTLPLIAALVITSALTAPVHAQTFTTLSNFNDADGDKPEFGSLIQATNGNYYGTTYDGGKNEAGVVFEVARTGELSDVYSFCPQPGCVDGQNPWSSLVLGSDGNLYGTTLGGGAYGWGTIYKITIGGKLTTLYSFCPAGGSCTDGEAPVGLAQASNGNLYGTTNGGGAEHVGTVFEISKTGKFKSLYSFCSKTNCVDGSQPWSGLIQAANGNLYGTTYYGGANGAGTVYEITPGGEFKTLYSFCP